MASSFTTNGVESTSRPAFEATASHSAEDGNNEQMFATNNGYSVTERFDQGSDFAPASGNFTAPITHMNPIFISAPKHLMSAALLGKFYQTALCPGLIII